MKYQLSSFIIALLLLTSIPNHAINKEKKLLQLISDAEIEMLHGNFSEAILLLNKAKKINTERPEIYFLQTEIAESSKNDSLLLEASRQLYFIFPDQIKYIENYISLLVDNAAYAEALQLLKSNDKVRNNTLERLQASCKFAIEQLNYRNNINVRKLNSKVNTNADEYWPSYSAFDSTLYFTRLIEEVNLKTERIYFQPSYCNTCQEELIINDNPNFSEANISISLDGKLLFLTICGGAGGKGSCDIYYSLKGNDSWSQPQKVPDPVSTKFWESQPMLSPDGTQLFFVSNCDGGLGGMDIYVCDVIYPSNLIQFENVRNVGTPVNTSEDDFSPILSFNNTFYFSSNGHIGMGKSDLFSAQFNNGKFDNIQNLGFPINTNSEEAGLTLGVGNNLFYFHSDRTSECGNSKDIYEVVYNEAPVQNLFVFGAIYNQETSEQLSGNIQFQNEDSAIVVMANHFTGYRWIVDGADDFRVGIILEGFQPFASNLNLQDVNGKNYIKQNFSLTPLKVGKSFIAEDILFDFDSADLLETSVPRLKSLIQFLKTNPKVTIEIIGHTDVVGDEQYNQRLSENRAKAIFQYLSEEIDQSRLSYSGRGASNSIASNETEEGRAKNRRTEIKILELDHSINQ